jgi:presenilin-like A22 family membrane protease
MWIMKHNLKVTLILVGVFFISQVIGLLVVDQYLDHKMLSETGEISFEEIPYLERPPVEESNSFWYIFVAILFGTGILLLIIKFKKVRVWKAWYFLSVVITLTVALYGFSKIFGENNGIKIAFVLAILAAYFKIYKPNVWLHNITEVFIYGGLAAIFVPIMDIFSALMLLILISIYDMYAVWKSKHMVKLAEFTTESNVFAGLSIPYNKKTGKIEKKSVKKLISKKGPVRNAILGGGDIGFPLLFAGVVMKGLMKDNIVLIGFLKALIIPIATSIALYILFTKGEKNKFYPAMPFLTAGCLVGYGMLWILEFLV